SPLDESRLLRRHRRRGRRAQAARREEPPHGTRPRRLISTDEPKRSSTMMRPSIFVVLGVALAAAMAPHPAASQTPAKITIGTGTAADFLPAFIARDKGIFAKH